MHRPSNLIRPIRPIIPITPSNRRFTLIASHRGPQCTEAFSLHRVFSSRPFVHRRRTRGNGHNPQAAVRQLASIASNPAVHLLRDILHRRRLRLHLRLPSDSPRTGNAEGIETLARSGRRHHSLERVVNHYRAP